MRIQDIHRPKGANKSSKRVGRGVGSGHGKTSTRGHKGARARSGPALRLGFEGGQMPLIRRLPKRGFTNPAKKAFQVVNVKDLNRFKKDTSIDKNLLKEAGLIKKLTVPVKILGDGKITKSLNVSVENASESAKKKIEEAGGKITIITKK